MNARSKLVILSLLCALPCAVACTSSTSSAPSSREQARSYARGSVPCATDTDCCVVVDRCINQALVVRATDRDKVASLVASDDPGGCTACLLPAVQVSCDNGQCAGALVSPVADGGADAYAALSTDHCGTLPGIAAKSATPGLAPRAILGCGPQ